MAKRLALVAGHGNGDPGAVGNGRKEADMTRTIVAKLQTLLKDKLNVYVYDTAKDLYTSKEWGKFSTNDEVIEVHLNAYSDTSVNGAETLIRTGYSPDSLDNGIQAALKEHFTNRGIKYRNDLQNMNAFAQKGISYRLIEVCFITNAADMHKLINNFDGIMADLANAILKGMGGSGTVSSGSGSQTATNDTYTVVKGDTLSAIAKKYSVGVESIVSANKAKYPKITADFIDIGWKLSISSSIHTVVKGDTLGAIAGKYNTTVSKIVSANKAKYPKITADFIDIGWKLTV